MYKLSCFHNAKMNKCIQFQNSSTYKDNIVICLYKCTYENKILVSLDWLMRAYMNLSTDINKHEFERAYGKKKLTCYEGGMNQTIASKN